MDADAFHSTIQNDTLRTEAMTTSAWRNDAFESAKKIIIRQMVADEDYFFFRISKIGNIDSK